MKPCESIYSSHTRYGNQSYTLFLNSLKNSLNKELYNEQWYDKPLHIVAL